jgi:hypothetical protein
MQGAGANPTSTASIITVISIVVLVITFLLGEYNTEERNGRPRYQSIYSTGLIILMVGLLISSFSLLSELILSFGISVVTGFGQSIRTKFLVTASFSLAILIVSIGTFFITGSILRRD